MLRSVLPVLAMSAMLFGACSPVKAPGVVMLAVSTNLVPGRDFSAGVLIAEDPNGSIMADFAQQEASFPWTFAFRAADPDSDVKYSVRARVLLLNNALGDVVVAARDVQFELPPPEEQQMVRVSLDWLSLFESDTLFPRSSVTDSLGSDVFPPAGNGCSDTTTLNALGQCVAIGVEASGEFDRTLEPYDPALIFGGGSSPSEGSTCLEAAACLEGGTVVTAARVGNECKVELPADVNDNTTLAVLTAPSKLKTCGELGCGDDLGPHGRGAVLDREAFTFSGRTVTLPSKVCDRFPDGAKILVDDACPKKERSLPLCPDVGQALGRVGATRQIGP